ncbi:type II TA system antitoxin MqsA family protein [Cyanobium sp. Cruz-8H5]|uniref:type II TA system antitoxin MqsA family protein n=1 Tax=Cyanobium sp. Cruz-8H5 TaxID=2823712 RepID=UPI0020CC0FEC|nr:type II TA system antitoxin MqsA family protein [Cyanobium sp. Cruz-8H5]MCP9861403.1 DUF4065 domain-containing protein [Cyanobium sp. Cruz-8H5]
MNKTVLCLMCEQERPFRRELRREEYEVRGEKIALDVPRLVCTTCGEGNLDEAFGDVTQKLYAEYRRRHGLLSPEQIRALREGYGLSQEAFAKLLGTSPATLARYESGSIQDKAYDQLLRACRSPAVMAELLEREGHHLTERQRHSLNDQLSQRHALIEYLTGPYPDLRHLSFEKYAAVVVWFCKRLKSIPHTKVCKLLFYADFLHYQKWEEAITGCCYKRLPHGPVPVAYDFLHGTLAEAGLVETVEVEYGDGIEGTEFRPGPQAVEPERWLSPAELHVLEVVANRFEKMTASKISRLSHRETAWLETPSFQVISYDHAKRLSVRLSD